MTSATQAWHQLRRGLRHARREEHIGPVLGAAALLIVVGTLVYSLGNGWSAIDALYFAVATLTTSTVADPDLTLEDGWMKLFTVLYVLIGIGVLVEIGRRLATAFIAVRRAE